MEIRRVDTAKNMETKFSMCIAESYRNAPWHFMQN